MRVRDLMTTKVFSVRADRMLSVVPDLMGSAHIRHIPVVDQHHRLVGIVSQRDLLSAATRAIASPPGRPRHVAAAAGQVVAQVMKRPVHTATPDDTVRLAASLMRLHKVGCLPVVEGDQLVGIITESDLLTIVERLTDDELVEVAARPVPPRSPDAGAAA